MQDSAGTPKFKLQHLLQLLTYEHIYKKMCLEISDNFLPDNVMPPLTYIWKQAIYSLGVYARSFSFAILVIRTGVNYVNKRLFLPGVFMLAASVSLGSGH